MPVPVCSIIKSSDVNTSPDLTNFNWAPVVVIGVFILANGFWVFYARHWFQGPPIDTETKWQLNSTDVNNADDSAATLQLKIHEKPLTDELPQIVQ